MNEKSSKMEKKMAFITTAEKIGIEKGKKEVVIDMLKEGMEIALISKLTKFSKEKILEIKKEIEKENKP